MIDPELLPYRVTVEGSPPNVEISSCTHCRASTVSCKPMLPGAAVDPRVRKPASSQCDKKFPESHVTEKKDLLGECGGKGWRHIDKLCSGWRPEWTDERLQDQGHSRYLDTENCWIILGNGVTKACSTPCNILWHVPFNPTLHVWYTTRMLSADLRIKKP